MDSCDASVRPYAAMNDPDDVELKTFSLARDDAAIIPFLLEAERISAKKLNLLLSPWSPPAFMKTNGERNHGGKLKPEYYPRWAAYICRYIKEYQKRGLCVMAVTVQNEPHATQRWDSCTYTAQEEKSFLRDHLYPALAADGLHNTGIMIWDHNKERALDRARDMIDNETYPMIAGVAFHWYSGDHFDAIRMISELYPDKKLFFTEGCVEYSRFSSQDQLSNARMYGHDIIGNLNHGMHASMDWNLLTDEKGGPNHVSNWVEAPLMYDAKTNRLKKKLSFEYIGHFSRYLKPGATRIGHTQYTGQLDATAFENTDGSIAAVFMNKTPGQLPLNIRLNGQVLNVLLAGDAIATLVIKAGTDK
jgi:glucosylceramidase